MPVKTVAILSPGDMGHAVGRALGETGLDVITCLQGRSERTRKLARRGNIRDVTNLEEMVTQADLILSILVPEEAVGVARSVADALRATGCRDDLRRLQRRLAKNYRENKLNYHRCGRSLRGRLDHWWSAGSRPASQVLRLRRTCGYYVGVRWQGG